MRREPGLLLLMIGIGLASLAIKKTKPVAKVVGDFLVKAGEEFRKAAEEPTPPPVANAEASQTKASQSETTHIEGPAKSGDDHTEVAPENSHIHEVSGHDLGAEHQEG